MPYRIKVDPGFYNFGQTAAQASATGGGVPEGDYASYAGADLSQDNDFDTGLQPGDLTKYMALPWQADFNECSTQVIDVTYEGWNDLLPRQRSRRADEARAARLGDSLVAGAPAAPDLRAGLGERSGSRVGRDPRV